MRFLAVASFFFLEFLLISLGWIYLVDVVRTIEFQYLAVLFDSNAWYAGAPIVSFFFCIVPFTKREWFLRATR